MVKYKIGLVILFIIVCLTGCGNKDTIIVQEKEAWDCTDIEISGIPEDAYVETIASSGIYYGIDCSKTEPAWEMEFHFLDYSGNDKMLMRISDMNAYSIENMGDNMILCNMVENGINVFMFSPDGNVKTLFSQNAFQFPYIETSGKYVASICNNNLGEDANIYENLLILQDTEKNEEKVIYRALWDREKRRGEDLGCVSINDKTVCFFLYKYHADKEKENILCLYDIEKEEIVKEISLPMRVFYAAYGGDKAGVLLSETAGSEYLEEAGSVGYVRDDIYVESTKIPLVSASNDIRHGRYTGSGYYFVAPESAYYWDTNANKIYVYEYQWEEGKYIYTDPTVDGIKYLVKDGNSTYIRTVSVK